MIKFIKKSRNVSLLIYFLLYLIIIPSIIMELPSEYRGIANFILSLSVFLTLIWFNKEIFNDGLKKLFEVFDKSLYVGLVSIGLLIISIVCSFAKIDLQIGNNEGYTSLINLYIDSKLLFGIYIIVLSPIIEEIIYKSLIFDKTKFLNNNWIVKIIVISIIFSCMHILNEIFGFQATVLIDGINYFVFSMATFICYRKSNNIFFPIAVHMLCNAVALVLL